MAKLTTVGEQSLIWGLQEDLEHALQKHLREKLKPIKEQMLREVEKNVDYWISNVAVNLMKEITWDWSKETLRISVNTKDIAARINSSVEGEEEK